MAIVVSKNGGKAKKVEETKFKYEDAMQAYIKSHPEVIPVNEIAEGTEVFIAAREFPTNSGPIDAIGFDRDGNIYIIETKLYKNPDKRIVLGQVLDYGAALWKHGSDFTQFTNVIDDEVKKNFDLTFKEKLISFFSLDETGIENTMTNINTRLNGAQFKFLVVMDHLDDRLKDLISFLNTNSKFDVYAVELEYYKVDDYEIIIPKLYGNEVKKLIGSANQSNRKTWTKDIFFQEASSSLAAADMTKLRRFYDFAEQHKLSIVFGTGSVNGSFAPRVTGINGTDFSLFHVMTNGEIELISWFWRKYNETISMILGMVKKIKSETAIPIDDKNKAYISKISDSDIDKLFAIYTDVIGEISKMKLSVNADYK